MGVEGVGININYLVKIITENKVFHFLRNFCLPLMYDRCRY